MLRILRFDPSPSQHLRTSTSWCSALGHQHGACRRRHNWSHTWTATSSRAITCCAAKGCARRPYGRRAHHAGRALGDCKILSDTVNTVILLRDTKYIPLTAELAHASENFRSHRLRMLHRTREKSVKYCVNAKVVVARPLRYSLGASCGWPHRAVPVALAVF